MSDRKFNFVFTFTVICAFSAFIGWCGGYNFDQLNEWVGFWAAITILFASAIGLMVAEITPEDEIWKR